jgi:hypothetical protein
MQMHSSYGQDDLSSSGWLHGSLVYYRLMTFPITLQRLAASVPRVQEAQTNARLSVLAVPSGLILSPGLSPTVHAHTPEVPFATRKVRIEARAQSPGLRSITIDGTEIAGSSVVGLVDFQEVMARTITITTLAEDGVAQEQYTLRIRRFRPPPPSAQDHPQPR